MTSAQLLRSARTGAGLSQRQLAQRSGVAPTLISAYENGRRQPGADTLLSLLSAAGSRVCLESTVEASREAAGKLELVCALAMAMPRRHRGPLRYPSLGTLRAGSSRL